MASPTPVGSDITDYQQAEDSEHIRDWLANKTPYERVQYFRKSFHGEHQPIQDMDRPVLCGTHPDFADDVITAYLRQMTFTVKVWVNYDAACKKFYTDKRLEDCGKLVLSRKDRTRLKELMTENVEINRVTLEVGTAFNTFCYIALRVDQRTGKLIAKCKPETGEHPELINFLLNRCDYVRGLPVAEGLSGLSLEDLGQVATMLRREPDPADKVYVSRFSFRDPWMDLYGNRPNPGWVDFRALGKGESEWSVWNV